MKSTLSQTEKTETTYFKMEGLEPNIEGSKIHFTIGFVFATDLSLRYTIY